MLETESSGYVPYYRDFFKLWHQNINLGECKDPPNYFVNEQFPSNSYYPPGIIVWSTIIMNGQSDIKLDASKTQNSNIMVIVGLTCGTELNREFCPTSGESGSVLMVNDPRQPYKYKAEGILSFTKGCDVFYLDSTTTEQNFYLRQTSTNPTAYTKLYCYLPWIAKQYGLEYNHGDIAKVYFGWDNLANDYSFDFMSIFRNATRQLETLMISLMPTNVPTFHPMLNNFCIMMNHPVSFLII